MAAFLGDAEERGAKAGADEHGGYGVGDLGANKVLVGHCQLTSIIGRGV